MKQFQYPAALLAALVLSGCAHLSKDPEVSAASLDLRKARCKTFSTETRAAFYVKAAAKAAPTARQVNGKQALETYNAATQELSLLLRTAEEGRFWNRPLRLNVDGTAYRFHFQPGNQRGIWAPEYFTSFVPANKVKLETVKRPNRVDGIGGTLVGIRKETPREPFTSKAGITAPVTATLDFKGNNATLVLRDPATQQKASIAGMERRLAGDFSAPLAYYPHLNEWFNGIMGAVNVSRYLSLTGLYLIRPYDPERIPVIFVHGLISTPRMWRNVINELEMDPVLRSRYQFWVFGYPTGNPAAYSALRLREELAKVKELYGLPHGFVLVGHSMGGLLSQMQGTTVTRADWDRIVNTSSEHALMDAIGNNGVLHDALIFKANPDIRRTVFICTPHRGSEMATSSIGKLGMRLINLPGMLVDSVNDAAFATVDLVQGKDFRFPTSVTSLRPQNPTLKVLDSLPLNAPSHTILGDRGKNGPLEESSDGVVPYWSSHFCQASSEKVVPGPHGACEMPETIAELKRILHLHLKETRATRGSRN